MPPISSTPQDFVSVEFDDGDSGRIRLKNIRLLLSNYPIAGVCPGHFCLCILSLCIFVIYFLGDETTASCACQARTAKLPSGVGVGTSDGGGLWFHSKLTFYPVLRILCSHYLLCCCFRCIPPLPPVPVSVCVCVPVSVPVHRHGAEYNDNPLYSVGKQKRGALRSGDSGSAGSGCQQEQSGGISGGDEGGPQSHHGFSMSSDNTTSLAATMELFTQRSEKKRLKKSLKKLTKAQNGCGGGGGGQSTESNGFQTDNAEPTAGGGDSAGLDDGNRKHHKHKKRKKHKKHHRKNDNEEAEQAGQDAQQLLEAVAAEAAPVEELSAAATTAPQRVKVEVKVKAEQLDIEEETTSNLMSEVSDEVSKNPWNIHIHLYIYLFLFLSTRPRLTIWWSTTTPREAAK